jgi:hypothetical protein
MAAYVGKNGFVSITAGTSGALAYIDSFTLNAGANVAEVTAYGDSAKKYVHTLREASASISGTMDRSGSTQALIFDQFEDGTLGEFTVRLYPASTEFWAGQALFTTLTANSAVGDKVGFSANLNFSGGINYYTTGSTS